jgi:hypothetical protein
MKTRSSGGLLRFLTTYATVTSKQSTTRSGPLENGGTLQDQTGPVFVKGYFSSIYVREGDAWKVRMLTLTEHPRPAPSAETK